MQVADWSCSSAEDPSVPDPWAANEAELEQNQQDRGGYPDIAGLFLDRGNEAGDKQIPTASSSAPSIR